MMNRREFVTIGATALAASAATGNSLANTQFASDPAAAWTHPFRVIFDLRFQDAQLFALHSTRLGATLAGIENDVAALWYDELGPRLRQGPVALAGLTTPSALFCLQQLASNHWMKLRFRAEHHATAGLLEHRLQGSQCVLQRARDLLGPHTDWRTQMADLVTRCPVGTTTTGQCTLRTRADRSERAEHSLVSWIITA